MFRAIGTAPLGVVEEVGGAATANPSIIRPPGLDRLFWLLEIDALVSGSVAVLEDFGIGVKPVGTLALVSQAVPSAQTFRVSDAGYFSDSAATIGRQFFPPYLQSAFSVDRQFNLDPAASGAGASWGSAMVSNPRSTLSALVNGRAVDGRRTRILIGRKTWDGSRGLHVDPAYTDLREAARLVAQGWRVAEDGVEIVVRGASYKLEAPWQSQTYGGTGGADGQASLTGLRIPRARGGTTLDPIRNVTPALLDPVTRIFQYSDGRGSVANLYERGLTGASAYGTAAAADYADYATLAAASHSAGTYATCDALGLFRVFPAGAIAGEITADVTGEFPSAGAKHLVGDLARYALIDDCGIDPADLDESSFIGVGAIFPYTGGFWTGTEENQAVDIVAYVLRSIGAQMVEGRGGLLTAYGLVSGTPRSTWTTANIVKMRPVALPDTLDPPTWRWRVGFQRNHTVQTSDLSTDTTVEARKAFLAEEWRYAAWSDDTVRTSFIRANDGLVPTCLLIESEALLIADYLGGLWGVRRRLFEAEMWLDPLTRDLGDTVTVDYPLDDFAGGQRPIIVREALRGGDQAMTLQLLL